MTIKQAGLVAMETFNRIIDYAVLQPERLELLTPLTDVIFSHDSLREYLVSWCKTANRPGPKTGWRSFAGVRYCHSCYGSHNSD